MFDLIDDIFTGAINTVDDIISDPIGKSVEIITQPLNDGIDIITGLSEGELRMKAIASLGADVVSGMALSEIISWYVD